MEKYIVTMLGEKDHGKSTLIGNLLIATGTIMPERIKEARGATKGKRFEPAYLLDSFSEEREQEMTIDTTRAEVIHNNKMYELIDVPGHLELIKNMISGASNARVAILMVSAKPDERFTDQSKRHIFLAAMLGIDRLIVAVNKMDIMNYNLAAFDYIKREVADYLDAIDFKGKVLFVPISAYLNENTVKRTNKIKWYDGDPLIQVLESFSSAKTKPKEGLRALVQDIYTSGTNRTAFCIVYSGKMKTGERLHAEPSGTALNVLKIHVKGRPASSVTAGANAAVAFKSSIMPSKGEVLYGATSHTKPIQKCKSKIFAIKPISYKKRLVLKMNNNSIALKSIKVNEQISPVSGKISKGKSNSVAANSAAIVELSLASAQPIEPFSRCEELGRFMIYDANTLIGIGRVEKA